MAGSAASTDPTGRTGRVLRHALADRIFHWAAAAAVLTLLGTAFLPILGLSFPWVTVHWMAGIALGVIVLWHIVRALFWQDWRAMWIGRRDLCDVVDTLCWTLRRRAEPPGKPGKYSLAQKLIHVVFALAILTTLVTGGLMLVRIDAPWWQRNPYWLPDATWGVIYVLHGLAALALITIVMAHVYFALRPEKLFFTRSMVLGWITREEYAREHDQNRWQVDR